MLRLKILSRVWLALALLAPFAAYADSAAEAAARSRALVLKERGEYQLAAWTLSEAGLDAEATSIMRQWNEFVDSAKVVGRRVIGGSSTDAVVLRLKKNDRVIEVLFKRDSLHAADPASVGAEIAAHKLDSLLGLNSVPAARAYEYDGTPGSLHAWVGDTQKALLSTEVRRIDYDERGSARPRKERIRRGSAVANARKSKDLLFFDKLISNNDRHWENFAFRQRFGDASKAEVAWDNGLAFSERGSFRVERDWPTPSPELEAKLRALSPDTIRRELGPHLSVGQLNDLLRRRNAALETLSARRLGAKPKLSFRDHLEHICEPWIRSLVENQ